jgi:hypothetical protein
MPSFIKSLISNSDANVDSIIVGGVMAMVTLCAVQAWDVGRSHKDFNPISFGGGAAAILGAIGTGKAIRNKFTPVGDPATLPDTVSDRIAAASKGDGENAS